MMSPEGDLCLFMVRRDMFLDRRWHLGKARHATSRINLGSMLSCGLGLALPHGVSELVPLPGACCSAPL